MGCRTVHTCSCILSGLNESTNVYQMFSLWLDVEPKYYAVEFVYLLDTLQSAVTL